jgi:hypothetical protein
MDGETYGTSTGAPADEANDQMNTAENVPLNMPAMKVPCWGFFLKETMLHFSLEDICM